MDRINPVRKSMQTILAAVSDENSRAELAAHIHGVSLFAAMLARLRNENEELASIAGLLHDVYRCAALQSDNHAVYGAQMAQAILEETGSFAKDEIRQIVGAIEHHSEKASQHSPFDEILKDADVLEHVFSQPTEPISEKERKRCEQLRKELNL